MPSRSGVRAIARHGRCSPRAGHMKTDGTHRALPGRGTAGRQRSFAASASHPRIDRRAGARGQVLAMTAVSLIALCALVGLAADTGYFFDNRRRIQTAAAAALAGAEQLRRAGTTQVVTAANSAATANGFTDGVSGTTITVG